MLNRRRFVSLAAAGLAAPSIVSSRALGAGIDWPAKPVHIIVPFTPGGSTDITARLFGQYLSEKLGQQFIIENKPGAGNNIATEQMINAPPDGYTLFLTNPANAINQTLYSKISFNFIRDTEPVAGIMRVPNLMEVTPSMPVKTYSGNSR
jgi:tripartite-type tricarboxylate transporter receptor subunit TctC